MNAGFLRPPTIVPVNNLQIDSTLTGVATNIAAQNLPSALNINVDVKTPSLTMIYLIRFSLMKFLQKEKSKIRICSWNDYPVVYSRFGQ